MIERNIVLIGFMGSGKSIVSNKLAKILRREVLSTDRLIEEKEGRVIAEIFKARGEVYFRKVEREVVREISTEKGVILDCGGGVVLNADNIIDLKKNGILIYLSASPEWIYRNIKDQRDRPLLDVKDPQARIEELLNKRRAFYEQADYVVETDHKTVDQVCEEILGRLSYE